LVFDRPNPLPSVSTGFQTADRGIRPMLTTSSSPLSEDAAARPRRAHTDAGDAMGIQRDRRYVAGVAIEAFGVDASAAVHPVADEVTPGAVGHVTVGVDEVREGAEPVADAVDDAETVEGGECAWGRNDHKPDARYHGEYLGVASSKVANGLDR
jgi:hypothetical protein